MIISAKTKTAALFGYPSGHSLSPIFQNAAFRQAGCNAVYLAFEVPPAQLADALHAARTLGFIGANLTIPHKEAVIPMLDEVSPLAHKIGSVNTIVNEHGKLRGETTDGEGFLRSLREETGIVPAGRRFMIIGTGGAGRAIAFSLVESGADVVLCNRTAARAESLAAELTRFYPGKKVAVTDFRRRAELTGNGSVDCLVNASSVGLKPDDPELFSPADLSAGMVVCDLIYHQLTPLAAAAARRGLKTIDGLGMLIYQGALSFEMWTGCQAPVPAMFAAARAALAG